MKNKSALFIVTRSSKQWKGAEGIWIMMAGWAQAAQDLWGHSLVCTTDRIFTAEETLSLADSQSQSKNISKASNIRKIIPEILITIYKDIRLYLSKPKKWPIEKELEKGLKDLKFICERHDLFAGVGKKLAVKYNVPFLVLVDAPVVWEAEKWGVKRGLWGVFLERFFEKESLMSADLVICISEKVRDKVIEFGVSQDKTIVAHNKVNNFLFNPEVNPQSVLDQYKLNDKIVIGWTGSFRSFHGLVSLIRAFKLVCEQRNDVRLILVGDGQEFDNIKELVQELGLANYVIFTGKQPYKKIPEFVSSFDIGIVSARNSDDFHYSPLKLQEYFACGKPTIIPNAGDLSKIYKDKEDVLFYTTGDAVDLSQKINNLINDADLRKKLIISALKMNEKYGTWKSELKRVLEY